VTAKWWVIFALLASACADDPGPLDRSTIAAIAKSRGDAQGGERTGLYHATLEIGECDCPDDLGFAVCLSKDLVESLGVMFDVVEGDGFMAVRSDGLPREFGFSGAIDADGTATLGSVFIGFDLDAELVFLGRIDAVFGEDGELTGSVSLGGEGRLAGDPVRCGFDGDVEGVRLP
jgi:hypothetical protein